MPLVSSTETEKFAEYRKFIKNYQGTTCTQDPDWTLVKSNWEGYNVYLDDENGKIIAAVTIQTITNERGWTFAYGLKGPMMDRTDLVLMQKLYDEVENVLSDKQVFLIRMDPETVYTEEYKKALESAGLIVRGGGLDSHGTIQPRFNMVLDLVDKTPEDLMAEFHKKTRYNIRLAGRRDVEVKWDDSDEAIETFFKLHEEMSARQGISYRPIEYFRNMRAAFGAGFRVYLASNEEDVLGAAIAIVYGDKAWYAYGGSSDVKRNLMPNYLLQWEMINWAMAEGCRRYDFAGVFALDDSDGLYKFKNGFTHTEGVSEYIGEIDRVLNQTEYELFN